MPDLRTILRRTIHTAAAVSTLLLLVTLILWPVSHYREVHTSYGTADGRGYLLGANGGWIQGEYVTAYSAWRGWQFQASNPVWTPWSYQDYLTWNTPDPDDPSARTYLGVSWYQIPTEPGQAIDGMSIPFSYLALLFSILPLLAFRSIRRRRKAAKAAGLCPKCGYDLRAHQPGDRCPECGTPVAA